MSRLLSFAVTTAVALSLSVAGAAPATSAVAGSGNPEPATPSPHAAVSRLVITGAATTTSPGSGVAYAARGYDDAGRDLGDVTARTVFSISPDGSCRKATCTAIEGGKHTVTGTFERGNSSVSDTATLQVVVPPDPAKPAASAVKPRAGTEKPPQSAVKPPAGTAKPRAGTGKPTQSAVKPPARAGSPSSHAVKPSASPAKPAAGTAKPSASSGQPRGGVHGGGNPAVLAPGTQAKAGMGSVGPHAGSPESLARLVLSPARTFAFPGEPVRYTARAYDADGNDLGDVTARTTFSITFSAGGGVAARPEGSCMRATCTGGKYGRHTITGTAQLADGLVSGTAALQVVPRRRGAMQLHRLASIELYPQSAAIESGTAMTYVAYGYDAEHRLLGNVTRFTSFSISPDGSCIVDSCTATATQPSLHTVTGSVRVRNGQVTGSASLLVIPVLTRLAVEPGDVTVEVGLQVDFTAFGVDAQGRHVVNLTDYTQFVMDPPGACDGSRCGSSEVGTYAVTGTVTLGDRTMSDSAEVQVIPRITSLGLYPTPPSIRAGETVTYAVKGLDGAGRAVLDLSAQAVLSISEPGSCSGLRCTAAVAKDYTVTAAVRLGNRTITGTDILEVSPGPIAMLTLDPSQTTMTAGDRRSYRARGADTYGNDLGDVTDRTSFGIGPDGSCTGATCTATRVGRHTVTGSVGEGSDQVKGTAVLDVLAGPLAELTVDAPPTMTAGEGRTLRSHGLDAYGNPLGELTDTTRFGISPDGACAFSICTVTVVGRHRVTGSVEVGNGQVIGTAIVDVVAGPLAVVVLDPPEATVAAGDGRRYRAYGSDAYGNRLDEVTDGTTFTIRPDGSCTRSTCSAKQSGSHTVIGTVRLDGGSISGRATLTVTAGETDVRTAEDVVSLDLSPRSGSIQAGATITYSASGVDAKGTRLGALAAVPRFTISPDGSCAAATCTATRLGRHTVTGILDIANGRATGTAVLDVVAGPLATLTVGPPAVMTSSQSQEYRAYGSDSYGNTLGEVTHRTTFTISPEGSCARATCTAAELGRHTVTGAVDVAGRTVTGATPLLVLSRAITGVTLNPRVAEIRAAGKVTYTATGVDGADRAVADLTGYTSFSISDEGSCTQDTCTASELGVHSVTGTVQSPDGVISGEATLRVTAPEINLPPGPIAGLELNPKSAESPAGTPVTYIAIGVDANGTRLDKLGDLTSLTRFSISPDGSCSGAECTAATPGPHTVTGTLSGTLSGTSSGTVTSALTQGDRPEIVTAATTDGDHAEIVTAGFTAASSDLIGSARLTATTASGNCLLSKGNVRSLDVTPGEATPGSSVRIEGSLDSRFATCHVVLLLGGGGPGRDTALKADGSTSWDWTVPSDASQGTTTMTLTTIDGQVLVSRQFQILSGSDSRSPLWFVFAVLVLAALGTAAASAERDRRQRRWVGEHVRTEPHGDAGRISTGRARDTAPTVTVRLQPHTDTGTTTITKEGDR